MRGQNSAVARLRRQIELECEAIQRLANEPAMVASHEIIRHRYDVLGSYHARLKELVGEQEATAALVQTYSEKVG